MHKYEWDKETGGLLLTTDELKMSKEPRPVYSKELDLLGFNKYWKYDKNDSVPLMWAEANNYIYYGRTVAQVNGGAFFTAPEIIIIDEPVPIGEKLVPVNLELMIEKNSSILELLTNVTIKKVTETYESYRNRIDFFHVSYSGGKDSEVAFDIVQKAIPHNQFVVIFGDTGMEMPDTYYAIELMKQKCAAEKIKFVVAKSHMTPVESWNKMGPPTATVRWCCSVHKTTPQLLTIRSVIGKGSFTEMAFVGVRADESLRRSGYDYISYGMKHRGQYSCYPLLNWNSAEVYLYIYSNNLHLNNAYKHGSSRVGCLVCPVSTNRNDFINHRCYSYSTQPLIDIIHDLNIPDKGNEDRLRSYIENNGWKARKSGRDVSIAPKDYDESIVGGDLVITFHDKHGEWLQWLKTLGHLSLKRNGVVEIEHSGEVYSLRIKELGNGYKQITTQNAKTPSAASFAKNIRKIFRKSHYCISCKVCEANCKYGNLIFDNNGLLSISDNCIKCGQCLEIDTGCLAYKSLWLSKGLGNMNTKNKSIDCYDAHGPKMEWFEQWVKLKENFKSQNKLGSKQIPAFNRFLRDAGVIDRDTITKLGTYLQNGIEKEYVWALMYVNLTYSPEVGWFIHTFDFQEYFNNNSIINALSETEGVSESGKKSIPAALKRIMLLPFSTMGFCVTEKDTKEKGGYRFVRIPWQSPNPDVILYSLYRFAEACGDYKQFTLTRLMDTSVDSDGVSPVQIFGLDRETMKIILNGLSVSRPDFINVSFTLDLDNITLRDDKTSEDVLNLFNQ